MAVIDRIRKRLAEEHDIVLPEDTEIRRLGGGQWARAQGRWSWSLWSSSEPGKAQYGSQVAATDLLKCRNWSIDTSTYDMSIDPCRHCWHGGPCKEAKDDWAYTESPEAIRLREAIANGTPTTHWSGTATTIEEMLP